MPTFLFVISGLGLSIVLLGLFIAPDMLTPAIGKVGLPAVFCLLAGLRLRKDRKIKASPAFVSAKQQAIQLFHIRADIESCLRTLPEGYHLKQRGSASGFLSGAFRSFERVVVEGPLITITVDCIGSVVVARHIHLRDSPYG